MPSTLPSTFASAAAGIANELSFTRNASRTDGTVSSDRPKRSNGATQTFRRASHLNSSVASSQHATLNPEPTEQSTSNAYPTHASTQSRNGSMGEMRYSRSQLLDLFRALQGSHNFSFSLADLAVGDLDSGGGNDNVSTRWGRRDETLIDGSNIDICGVPNGSSVPSGLTDLTDEEELIFATSVNSPLKPPNTGLNKEGMQREGQPGRKASMSQGNGPSAFALVSPVAKSTNRRRDISDAFPFPRETITSPSSASNFTREELVAPRTAGFRQRFDKHFSTEVAADVDESAQHSYGLTQSSNLPFATLKRAMTGPVHTSMTESASPWVTAPQSAGLSSLGPFGNFAIGSGSSGNNTAEKRPNLAVHRMESRFRSLMTKDQPEDASKDIKAKKSSSSLGKADMRNFQDESTEEPPHALEDLRLDDTDYYHDDESGFGSAALGGGYDMSPNDNRTMNALGTPLRHRVGGFGLAPSESHAMGEPDERRFGDSYGTFHAPSGHTTEEPMSPTYTNPYQSPDQRTATYSDVEMRGSGVPKPQFPGLGGLLSQNVVNAPNELRGADRGQTSSTGPGRGFPALSGLGTLAGLSGSGPWSALPASASRERHLFQDALKEPILRSSGDLHSPSISKAVTGSSNVAGRGSRMGSLFPLAMQEQMRGSEVPRRNPEDLDFDGRDNDVGAVGSRTFGSTASMARIGSDSIVANETSRSLTGSELQPFRSEGQPLHKDSSYSPGPAMSSQAAANPGGFARLSSPINQPLNVQQSAITGDSPSLNQPPTAQQKTMVMPDRIRWIYRDPQGHTQGPWSGLEMHDWYKAGFFSPELLVKKVEDADYEPLAQLIRRIGNSREPFLVPQIGIPGPPTSQSAGWPNQTTSSSSGHASTAMQPPFASSFPSFGTTLTADQQNALERRKQEEQYLMARQKEHLAQQQVLAKQMQIQGSHALHSQQIHHNSGAHSLQSQPSLAPLSAPNGYPSSHGPLPAHGNQVAGFLDSSFRSGAGPGISTSELRGNIQEEDIASQLGRLGLGQQQPSDDASQSLSSGIVDEELVDPRISLALTDREQLRQEQARHEISNDEPRFHQERLQQFQALSADNGDEDFEFEDTMPKNEYSSPFTTRQEPTSTNLHGLRNEEINVPIEQHLATDDPQMIRSLSLTEQVQQAASAKQRMNRQTMQTAWPKIDAGLPQQLPPAPSSSPLPAPAAQRNRQHVADVLTAESLSQVATSVESSSVPLAPWAKEASESQKQPSLKEIQEAEAKKAARREEIASAARRAALEREILAQPPIQTSGLPSSSTWGSGESPAVNSASASVWAKASSGASTTTITTQAKKTLQQIQKEEEALAKRQKALANNGSAPSGLIGVLPATSSGKRYADLASKAAVPVATGGGIWTTVGNGGKVKPPARSAPSPTSRSVSASAVTAMSTTNRAKPALVSTKSSSLLAAQQSAHEQLKKWATVELRPDLNKGIQVEDFVQGLFSLPSEVDIITEAVHGVSQTMDSRHFAEELVRRRKLADKGMMDSSGIGSAASYDTDAKSGGWSEVAKKGPSAPPKDDNSAFKVVAAKKKAGKK